VRRLGPGRAPGPMQAAAAGWLLAPTPTAWPRPSAAARPLRAAHGGCGCPTAISSPSTARARGAAGAGAGAAQGRCAADAARRARATMVVRSELSRSWTAVRRPGWRRRRRGRVAGRAGNAVALSASALWADLASGTAAPPTPLAPHPAHTLTLIKARPPCRDPHPAAARRWTAAAPPPPGGARWFVARCQRDDCAGRRPSADTAAPAPAPGSVRSRSSSVRPAHVNPATHFHTFPLRKPRHISAP
jgi:hypothetical protein